MNSQSNRIVGEDPFNLKRFVEAQNGVYEQVLAELRRARKETHWMWFIFPQFDGLGTSATAGFYAIKSPDEAKAYLNHPVLGPRLVECSGALLKAKGKKASEIFGFPDDLKLRSSMTLFVSVSTAVRVFADVIDQYFDGQLDQRTLQLMQQTSSGEAPS